MFLQGDKRWGQDLLGESMTTTMHKGGCLVTCLAIVDHLLDDASKVTPGSVNSLLRQRGRFMPKSGMLSAYEGEDFASWRMLRRDRITGPTRRQVDEWIATAVAKLVDADGAHFVVLDGDKVICPASGKAKIVDGKVVVRTGRKARPMAITELRVISLVTA